MIISPSRLRVAINCCGNLRQFKVALIGPLPSQCFVHTRPLLVFRVGRPIVVLILVRRFAPTACIRCIALGLPSKDSFDRVPHAQLLLVVALHVIRVVRRAIVGILGFQVMAHVVARWR